MSSEFFDRDEGGAGYLIKLILSSVLAYTNRIEGEKAKFNKFENISSKEKFEPQLNRCS